MTHDKVLIAEESAAARQISGGTCLVTFATGKYEAGVPGGTTGHLCYPAVWQDYQPMPFPGGPVRLRTLCCADDVVPP
jgi:hypothetical protein